MPKDQGPLTIHEAAAAIRAGALTPVDLLDQCLGRIEVYEPHVRAWAVIDRDGAREQAERLTAELKRGQDRGPLHGVPIGVKDIIDVFDLPTGCGSKLWANSIARRDADCVKRLRQAGAIILGKTVTTTFAYLDPPITRNPWNLERTPGGSSSGSAAAVACGMCLGALGSQTGGSITRPASFCGVCGLKPSWGEVSVDGVLPLASSLDHVGAMGRSVYDLAIMLQAMTRDGEGAVPNLRRWEPLRVGRLLGPFDELADLECRKCMDDLVNKLMEAGGSEVTCELIEVSLPDAFSEVWLHHRNLMAAEAAQYHGGRFRRRPEDYPPKITALIEDGLRLNESDRVSACRHRDELLSQFRMLFEVLDVLLTPAARGPAPGPETTGDPVFNAPWSYLRLPTVSFPIGAVGPQNLPIAAQLIGRPGGERELLTVAARCEEQIAWHIGLPPVPA
jgi:aspartyl-tRNA(Asn)/glutamyl-tRNA(Gln) amidotransferase subunit A